MPFFKQPLSSELQYVSNFNHLAKSAPPANDWSLLRLIAEEAVEKYAKLFEEGRTKYDERGRPKGSGVHPDWQHDWPTREEILQNYYVHSIPYAEEMKATLVIDVQGGPVRIRYSNNANRKDYEALKTTREANRPLHAYTRNQATNLKAGEEFRQAREERWEGLREAPVTFPPQITSQWGTQTPLSIDFAYPRFLDTRHHPRTTTSGANLFHFSHNDERDVAFVNHGRGKFQVRQLCRIVPEGSPFYEPTTHPDDRKDGSPSSPFLTYLLLQVRHTASQSFDVVLRSRIDEVKESAILIRGTKWVPSDAPPPSHSLGIRQQGIYRVFDARLV
ncbi:hypothetical protein JCM3766R1_005310 [Sporobolomyces carnicolor]